MYEHLKLLLDFDEIITGRALHQRSDVAFHPVSIPHGVGAKPNDQFWKDEMEGRLAVMSFHTNPKYKEHFRLLSALFDEVEKVALQKWEVEHAPLTVAEVDVYLQQHNVNVSGAAVFWTMLKQSDVVHLSKDEKNVLPMGVEG